MQIAEKIRAFSMSALFACGLPLLAGAATLNLNDGSVIHGDVVALESGVYSVETQSLGTIRVRQSDVASIDFAAQPDDPSAGQREQIESLQRSMVLDVDIMDQIKALQSDAQIQAALADPEIAAAIRSGDLATLMANPTFMALLQNARLMGLTRQIAPAEP